MTDGILVTGTSKMESFRSDPKDGCILRWSILSLVGLEGIEADDQPDSQGIGTPLPWVLQVMLRNLFGVKD